LKRRVKIFAAALAVLALLLPATASAAPARCDLKAMANVAVPAPYMHPSMMAIGDSLYNGMSSMSIDDRRAAHSVPKFVANALGLRSFHVPAYPAGRPLLADFDDVVPRGELWIANQLGAEMVSNIRWWRDSYGKSDAAQRGALFADNIAVSQATSGQLLCDRPGGHTLPTGGAIPVNDWGFPKQDLFGLFYSLNMRFVLNPNRSRAVPRGYGNMSQMAQVMARKPQMLIVSVGANDALWRMAFFGTRATSPEIVGKLHDLARNMAAIAWNIPRETRRAYVNLMPPPSRIANLAQSGGFLFPGARGYFSRYQTQFNTQGITSLSEDDVRAMDRAVATTNRAIVDRMCGAPTVTCNPARFDPTGRDPKKKPTLLKFIDLAGMAYRYDAKHEGPNDRNTVPVTMHLNGRDCELRLDNREIRYALNDPPRCLARGGFFSYDNMHMTMIGYAVMANEVLSAMGSHARGDLQALASEIEREHLPSVLWIDPRADGVLNHLHLFLLRQNTSGESNCAKAENQAPCDLSSAMRVTARH
jgi:lysophospholipase L1-like esterase